MDSRPAAHAARGPGRACPACRTAGQPTYVSYKDLSCGYIAPKRACARNVAPPPVAPECGPGNSTPTAGAPTAGAPTAGAPTAGAPTAGARGPALPFERPCPFTSWPTA